MKADVQQDVVTEVRDASDRRLSYAIVRTETIGVIDYRAGRMMCWCPQGEAVYLLRSAEVIGWTEEPCPHEAAYLEHREANERDTRPVHPVNVAALVD